LQRQVILKKSEKVKEIRDLVQKFEAIGIADLRKVRAHQLQELKRELKDTAYLRVAKNALVERAISESKDKPNIERLRENLKGSNLLLFTNLNPFKLALILERSKMKALAKAGDIATDDVIVPAGNTGQPPGPIISQLGSVGIPTRIESGSVWVNRDTVVAKKGDIISESLAPILSKLGIKSVEMGLSLKAIYDDGIVIPEEQLRLNLDDHRRSLIEAYMQAFNLSLNAAYTVHENISLLIKIASQEAYNLAINAGIPSSETIKDLVMKAYLEAMALSFKIPVRTQEAV